ncbi:MAG TPA: uracil-DNA glycosylase [Rhizomicrobium sp.]|nr:uracil-DNA glycosylase [Rhizomicrobium sp.]
MPRSELLSFGALRWLAEAGADEAVVEQPVNRFRRTPAAAAPPLRKPETKIASTPALVPAPPASGDDPIGQAMALAAACTTLAELKAAIEAFEGCALKRHATRTVFADGSPAHRILFIGEAPGKDEDAAGLPFVGRAGKLLDKMLAAIGLDRKTNVYITNVLNWRPPGNRDPAPEEAAACLPFLRRHIELAAPEIMVLLGAVAVRHVMGKSEGIMRLRGNWLEYFVGGRLIPVMPTLHPAYLLRRPIDKKLAWRDLQAISDKVNTLRLLEPRAAAG